VEILIPQEGVEAKAKGREAMVAEDEVEEVVRSIIISMPLSLRQRSNRLRLSIIHNLRQHYPSLQQQTRAMKKQYPRT